MNAPYQPREITNPESADAIDGAYLSDILCNHHQRDDIQVLSFSTEQLKPGLVSSFAGGVYRYSLTCRKGTNEPLEESLILKTCASKKQLAEAGRGFLARLGYTRMLDLAEEHRDRVWGVGAAYSELRSFQTFIPALPITTPKIYHTVLDEETERYWIFMEDVSDLSMVDTGDDLSTWTNAHLEQAVRDMASLHAANWGAHEELAHYDWLNWRAKAKRFESTLPYWDEVLDVGLER